MGGGDARGAARDQPVEGLLSRDPLKVMYLKKHKTEYRVIIAIHLGVHVHACVCVCECDRHWSETLHQCMVSFLGQKETLHSAFSCIIGLSFHTSQGTCFGI